MKFKWYILFDDDDKLIGLWFLRKKDAIERVHKILKKRKLRWQQVLLIEGKDVCKILDKNPNYDKP